MPFREPKGEIRILLWVFFASMMDYDRKTDEYR